MENKLELAEVIGALREQLKLAERHGEGHSFRFNLDTVEVELQTVIEKGTEGQGGGKIKFWVFDVDTKLKGKYKKAVTHKIKLTLEPVDTGNLDPGTGKPSKIQLSGEE